MLSYCTTCNRYISGNVFRHRRLEHGAGRGGLKIGVRKECEMVENVQIGESVTFAGESAHIQRIRQYATTINRHCQLYGEGTAAATLIVTATAGATSSKSIGTSKLKLSDIKFDDAIDAKINLLEQQRMFGNARFGRRPNINLVIPSPNVNRESDEKRKQLPIFAYREKIMDAINQNQVVIISGETGSGKTTQVPQYIMESRQMCRILVTQPRRLAATSIAEQVSKERGDEIGKSVGYQIRFDSKISANTNLIYTTSGFLLRRLTTFSDKYVFEKVTHIILDEVHERDINTDILLLVLRESLKNHQNLKVVLMSATLDSEQFSEYFGNCPIIKVPGHLFDVKTMYLDQVLKDTAYRTREMVTYMAKNLMMPKRYNGDALNYCDIYFYDFALDLSMSATLNEWFDEIFQAIHKFNMHVDYVHSSKFRTALSIAAQKGLYKELVDLLRLGANPEYIDAHGKRAVDYAEENGHANICDFLSNYSVEKNFIARAYSQTTNMQIAIDHDLLCHIIYHIHTTKPIDGSILVFLPGFADIVDQKEKIQNNFEMKNYQLFMLHSCMDEATNSDQLSVFDQMPLGTRKIILSTNIAETSLTITDVVYVVDPGVEKQLNYDFNTSSTCLTYTNISQACAKQRMGRAGRLQNGFCYRLYSMEKYKTMTTFSKPEILRATLTQICLMAKMLTDHHTSIEKFLLKAMQPPPLQSIRQSIELLKKIKALNESEQITHLGAQLIMMPVHCQDAKMILYGRLLHCIDTVITIAGVATVKDVFTLPLNNKCDYFDQILDTKRKFAQEISDHQVYVTIYNEWSKLNAEKRKEFCTENHISHGKMLAIQNVRCIIIKQLSCLGFFNEKDARMIKELNENSENWHVVSACITAGLYPNVEKISCDHIKPHISSVTDGFVDANDLVVYCDKIKFGTKYLLRNVTFTKANTIALFVDGSVENGVLTMFPNFSFDSHFATLLVKLQKHFRYILEKLVSDPIGFKISKDDETIIRAILEIIIKFSYKFVDMANIIEPEQSEQNMSCDTDSWDSNKADYMPFQDLSRYRDVE